MLCFVLINSILLNRSCFWIKQIRNHLFPCVMTSRGLREGEQSGTGYGDSVSSVTLVVLGMVTLSAV